MVGTTLEYKALWGIERKWQNGRTINRDRENK